MVNCIQRKSLSILSGLVIALIWIAPACAQEGAPATKRDGGLFNAIYDSLFGAAPQATPATVPMNEHAPDVNAVGDMPEEGGNASGSESLKRINVLDDFDEAIKVAQLEQRPLLLIAGAQWCTWCRKLESELKLDDAEPILNKWVVVKIDVDAAPSLAEEFEVSSLPALRVLSADRRVAAKREGYAPLNELQSWLEEVAPQVDPSVTRVLYEKSIPNEEQLARLIEFLGNRSPTIRQTATQRLIAARQVSAKPVVAILGEGRLGQRLCALDILRSWGAPVEQMDPWNPDTILAEQLELLNSWIDNHPAEPTEPVTETPVDPQKINDTLTQLLTEPEPKRRLLLTEAMNFGRAIVPQLRARLGNATDIADEQKVLLKQLLLSSLASARTRESHASLLTAVASLNPDTHRKAATRLVELLGAEDMGLVEELVEDADPLVREATVPALQRLGQLQKPARLNQLLSDKSPSVRTAVLREISEDPGPRSVELLAQHAINETDEDLLVFTAKTLGELQPVAAEPLIKLLANSSWRVRAAALDALASQGEYRSEYETPVVSSEIFNAVLKAADDSDAFVRNHAAELVPRLACSNNAKTVVHFLLDRPEIMERFWKETAEYSKPRVAQVLADAALTVLDEATPEKIPAVIMFLKTLKPTMLKSRLPELLASQDISARIAALKASVAFLETQRQEQLDQLSLGLDQATVSHEFKPWYSVPDSFMALPAAPQSSEAASGEPTEEALSNAPIPRVLIPPDLNAVDDFFGGKPVVPAAPAQPSEPLEPPESSQSQQLRANLDALDQLFGAASKQPASEPAEASPAGTVEKKPLKLLSSWLESWHEQYANERGTESVEALRKLLGESASKADSGGVLDDSSNPQHVEATWLALASLASGRKDSAEQFANPRKLIPLNANPSMKIIAMPAASEVVPWLPPELRFQCLKEYSFDWNADIGEPDQAFLKAVTLSDDMAVADWLIEQVGSRSLSQSQFSVLSEILARALRGVHDSNERLSINGNELSGAAPFKSYRKSFIGTNAVLTWLNTQRARELSTDQRALLLVELTAFDYRLGSQSAVGCVAAATQWDREVEVATMIALGAETPVAADRAIQWLDHPVAEVRAAALDRLADPPNDHISKSWLMGAPMVRDNDSELPLFFLAVRPISAPALESLSKLMESDNEAAAWNAYVLLLASGREELDEWKDEELHAELYVNIVAALAKSRRTDDAAIQFYTRAEAKTAYFEKGVIGRLLAGFTDPKVKAIRKRIPKSGPF